MANIGIIDDNAEQSTTLRRALNHQLKKFGFEGSIVEQTPYLNPEQYFSFITDNGIAALILDERLNDKTSHEGSPVSYLGNELVDILRERLKDFPIYMITSHSGDADLLAKNFQFEDVINREEITGDEDRASLFVSRLLRSSQRFLESNVTELAQFTELSAKVATGDASPEDIERVKALQTILELPVSGFDDRKAWLDKYEEELKRLEELKATIQKKLEAK